MEQSHLIDFFDGCQFISNRFHPSASSTHSTGTHILVYLLHLDCSQPLLSLSGYSYTSLSTTQVPPTSLACFHACKPETTSSHSSPADVFRKLISLYLSMLRTFQCPPISCRIKSKFPKSCPLLSFPTSLPTVPISVILFLS